MTFLDPLVSTSIGASFFLLALVVATWKLEKVEFKEPETGFSPATVYMVLIFLMLFSVTISYISMSIALGVTNIPPEAISWVKYVEWGFSSPVMLTGILLLTRDKDIVLEGFLAQATLLMTGFAATMLTGLLQILMWCLAAFSLAIVIHRIWVKGRKKVKELGNEAIKHKYYEFAILIGGLWSLYTFYLPMSFDGYQLIGFEMSRFVFTGLDIVSKLGFTFYLISSLETLQKNLI